MTQDLREISLHNAAQNAIAQGIRTAWRTQRSYYVHRPCAGCNRTESWDATQGLSSVTAEVSIATGTRSDIVLDYENGSHVVIEVVVSSDLSPSKKQIYERENIRCLRVFPISEELDALLTEVVVDAGGVNPGIFKCDDCAALDVVGKSTRKVQDALQPRCVTCGEKLGLLSVYVITISCWKCEKLMFNAFGQTTEQQGGTVF